jgi:cytochrome oxidase Cu insertion factor (SCO1/SenC/PrrC family)
MHRLLLLCLLAGTVALAGPGEAAAQDQQEFLAVGQAAPDIQVQGATRYGILSEPFRLKEFRGKTVVLAFFFRARSSG